MFDFIHTREQEICLLKFTKLEAQCNKHNIAEASKLDEVVKRDGSIHKTKMKQRATIVNGWKKEQKKLRDFFVTHQKEKHGYKYRTFRNGITNNRHGVENLFPSSKDG